MYQDYGDEIELQDFSGPINVGLDETPVADLKQKCFFGNPEALNYQILISILPQVSRGTQQALLSQLDLKNKIKERSLFATLLLAVRDRANFLSLFPLEYFTKQKHYSYYSATSSVNYRKTLNDYFLHIKDNPCKIALIDRLQELGYFCPQFFGNVRTMVSYELEHELLDWPKERRALLVTMPGNFFRYMDAIYYFGAIAPNDIFPYLDSLKKDQLIETFRTYQKLYFSSDLRHNASFLRAQEILWDYGPTSFFGRLFTNRTDAHVAAVLKVLASVKAGQVTTALGLVEAVLHELPIIPKQGALYRALLYITETNYVSLDEMVKTELAARQVSAPTP